MRWTRIINPVKPSPRLGCVAGYHDGELWLFGGKASYGYQNDLYMYDIGMMIDLWLINKML